MELLLSLLSNAGYWMQVILSFALLVVAHEFGHFIVAKWTGCRVDEFAVGFGPAIWQHQPKNSETLYAIRWIPLGGYNRIWGYEDVSSPDFFEGISEAEQKRAFVNRPIWARALVLVAGSTFNFMLAILLVACWGLFVGFPYTEIGALEPNSPAAASGMQPGDAVRNVAFFSKPGDISVMITRQLQGATTREAAEAQEITLEVTTPGQPPRKVTMHPQWNEAEGRAMIGIHMQEALSARLATVWEDSPYARAGLKKGDLITKVNGQPVTSGFQLVKALEESPGESAILEFRRGRELETTTLTDFRIWNLGVELYPQMVTKELLVAGVGRGSAAAAAGLRRDDIITAINGKPVTRKTSDWEKLVKSPSLPELRLSVVRKGEEGRRELLISPSMVDRMVEPLVFHAKYQRVDPLTALREGSIQTGYYTLFIAQSLQSLFAGEHEVSDLSGPIGIFSTSFQAAKNGAFDLMILMVLLSINLGIFNLLPFPALDGGRLIFLGLEALFRRPVVNIQVENMIHVGGFLLLIGLMLYVSFFDVVRMA